jgi:HSP20 family molecular chaperone IbpA
MQMQTIPVNVYEATEALVVVAPLPAVMIGDVTVQLRPRVLRIHALLRSAGPRDYLLHEWDYGGYEREIAIPDGFGSDVEASLGHGQLVIRILRGECTEEVTCQPKAIWSHAIEVFAGHSVPYRFNARAAVASTAVLAIFFLGGGGYGGGGSIFIILMLAGLAFRMFARSRGGGRGRGPFGGGRPF